MTIINLYSIAGIFYPIQNTNSCSQSVVSNVSSSEIETLVKKYSINTLIEIKKNFSTYFNESNSDFWTTRMVVHLGAVEAFSSISFVPKKPSSHSLLFVQKNKQEGPIHGFYAPFFSLVEQKKWNCIQDMKSNYLIQTLDDVALSINGIPDSLLEDIGTLLFYFLKDDSNSGMGLTYCYEGLKTTRFWFKNQ